jgi:multidrug efflux pump subunit AcrA (membrane-fusion protein)
MIVDPAPATFRVAGLLVVALAVLATLAAPPTLAQEDGTWTVAPSPLAEEKAVFATVESVAVVPARTRIGGTIAELGVDEGDAVAAGEVIAVVVDDRLAPQIAALDSREAALAEELEQARADLARDRSLFDRGVIPQARLEDAGTRVDVLANQVEQVAQERAVLVQQAREGAVEAPGSGRVLSVPLTRGTVVMPGETVARIAAERYVLRLRVPERHAPFISVGDAVRVDPGPLGDRAGTLAGTGTVGQVYPTIEDGRVVADAEVEGLGDYFVGERLLVFVSLGERSAILVPEGFLQTRHGVDFALVSTADGPREVVVQRGPLRRTADGPRIEVLAGLQAGDRLVQP